MRYFLLGLIIYRLVDKGMKAGENVIITACIAFVTGFIMAEIDFALFSILSLLILYLG
ncbi:hypothetical protein [Fusobacterium ulcerans]|uniref:hypothetical protein n=1 Tax=Fusobacterium ulcerans TaxID=861 RepID=UPI001559D321|nr:hypothetical protein [Fusobacterium ulcerans]